jgi:hypothetical protein
MDKTYNPQAIEQKWYQTWEQNGYFSPEATSWKQGRRDSYCIMIPPPNVTGRLHMGHAFQDTIMDALIRYHRMKGDNRYGNGKNIPAAPSPASCAAWVPRLTGHVNASPWMKVCPVPSVKFSSVSMKRA